MWRYLTQWVGVSTSDSRCVVQISSGVIIDVLQSGYTLFSCWVSLVCIRCCVAQQWLSLCVYAHKSMCMRAKVTCYLHMHDACSSSILLFYYNRYNAYGITCILCLHNDPYIAVFTKCMSPQYFISKKYIWLSSFLFFFPDGSEPDDLREHKPTSHPFQGSRITAWNAQPKTFLSPFHTVMCAVWMKRR